MNTATQAPMKWRDRLLIVLCLASIAALLFHESFRPGMVHFSSDCPLGLLAAEDLSLPEGFTGFWLDSNWLGTSLGAATPNFTFILFWLLGPVGTAKFLAPLYVFVLGLAAVFFFRVLGFRPMVCLIGGMAAELNSNFFSNACWGVGTRCSTLAATFLALAAIWSSQRGWKWLKLVLAGFAVGLAVMEGADNGAIFSLFVAAFAFYVAMLGQGSGWRRLLRGVSHVAVIAACAGVIAYQTVTSLVRTQITGRVGMQQDTQTKEERWIGATLWSLPKIETLRLIIPGLFGYRMDTEGGGGYWGRVGEHPQAPGSRHSGAGEYAGVLVVLIAGWALVRSCRRSSNTFDETERKLIWFWAGAALVAMLLGWGRFAPFYQWLYALPYASTIRNPMKFFHPLHMSLIILFAYGLRGLARDYLDPAVNAARSGATAGKGLWGTAIAVEKPWTYGVVAAVAVSVIGWFAMGSMKSDLVRHMTTRGIAAENASAIARFSIHEVGLFVLVLLVCAALLFLIHAGIFRGARSRVAWGLLGLVLFADMARANAPWTVYFNYQQRYEKNAIIDLLSTRRWEHRVANPDLRLLTQIPSFRALFTQDQQAFQAAAFFAQFYHGEWLQHQFQYYNVQTLDVAQDPRPPADKAMFLQQIGADLARLWELTNTRYLFGLAGGYVDLLNQQFDPAQRRFRLHTPFTLFQKPGTPFIGAQTNEMGPFALIEFAGALPRARLYSQWLIETNDAASLALLASPTFNPHESVILNHAIAANSATATGAVGTVEYASYSSKRIEQRVSAAAPGILLLNDQYDSNWKVTVDGKAATLLRCNFLMRGVEVPTGMHTVVWSYEPDLAAFYISLSALCVGAILCVLLGIVTRSHQRSRAKSLLSA